MKEKENKNYTINENGSIVVHNYCAAELPKITVTIRSDNPGLHTLRYEIYGEDIVSCSWGAWNEDGISCPLTITGLKSGEADVEIRLLDKDTKQFLFSVSIPVFVE